MHKNAFLRGTTSLGSYAIYDTLTEARQKCIELSSSDCRGVTYNAHGWPFEGWQLRRGNILEQSKYCEITFMRPSTEESTTQQYDLDSSPLNLN